MDDQDYQVPFAFTGTPRKITFDLGESTASPEAIKLMMEGWQQSGIADARSR